MEIRVDRYDHGKDDTLSRVYIDDELECLGLEDEFREEKVRGETRIPAGTYELKLRTVGGFHERYSKKYPEFHIGMLQVMNVPNFEYILIHQGNTDKDTAGCLILGTDQGSLGGRRAVLFSSRAYKAFYQKVAPVVASGQRVTITYRDL